MSLAPPATPLACPATQEAGAHALVGLIGAGIQRSLTPAMHMAEAGHHGLRLHYQLIDLDLIGATPEQLPALLAAARVMGFAGLNITYPASRRWSRCSTNSRRRPRPWGP